MRICFTSDFHGQTALYDQLEELLQREQPELVILGGDMLPDGNGPAPDRDQAAWVSRVFRRRVAAFKQAVPGLTVACCMGNHDWLASEQAIRVEQQAGLLVLLETRRAALIGGISFVGCPLSPPSPHFAKDYERLDEVGDPLPNFVCEVLTTVDGAARHSTLAATFRERPSLGQELDEIITPSQPWILVAHAPPYDSKLDRLPNLDYPIGSRAVRRCVENRRPWCALHGHVHEAPAVTGSFVDEIGGVPCINPGQGRERLQAVVFDSEQPRASARHTVFS